VPDYQDLILQLNELENYIARRAADLPKCRYAFTVILPESKYNLLCDIYRATEFFYKPFEFPWCHIKLLTETCARHLTREDHRLEATIAKKLQIQQLYKDYWKTFPKLLKDLNLATTREERGPWYVYANVVLHAGIIPRYFESLFEKAQRFYKLYGDKPLAIQELFTLKDIVDDPHYSRYFRQAFGGPTERQLLCRWLLKICRVVSDGLECADKLPNIPPAFTHFLLRKTLPKRSLISSRAPKSSLPHFLFNDAEGHIELHLIQDSAFTRDQTSAFTIDGDTPPHWAKSLQEAVSFCKCSFMLPILPVDMGKRYSCLLNRRRETGYVVAESKEFSALLFNLQTLEVIPPESTHKYKVDTESGIGILSRRALPSLKDFDFREVKGGMGLTWGKWYDWCQYELLAGLPLPPRRIEIGEPYGTVAFKPIASSKILVAQWSSPNKLPRIDKADYFGGTVPPVFLLRTGSPTSPTANDSPPVVVFCFQSPNSYYDVSACVNSCDSGWSCTADAPKDARQASFWEITARVYPSLAFDSEDNSTYGPFAPCIWYPGVVINIDRQALAFPGTQVRISITAPALSLRYPSTPLPLHIGSEQAVCELTGDDIENPFFIGFDSHSFFHEYALRLPYLQVFLATSKSSSHAFNHWSPGEPFQRDLIENIANDDLDAKFVFICYCRSILKVVDKSGKKLFKKIDFSENPRSIIRCSEILNFFYNSDAQHDPLLVCADTGEEAPLIINISKCTINFTSIFTHALSKFIYKEKAFYYGKQ